jgi:hypothetical protein
VEANAKNAVRVCQLKDMNGFVDCQKYLLAFPFHVFGLYSCGFLIPPLRKCFEFKSFGVHKAPVMLETEDDLFHRHPAFADDP